MVPVRPQPEQPCGFGSRLNLLLSSSGWRNQAWTEGLPRLLEPMGVRSWFAHSGREAADVIRKMPVHIAVVDLALPLDAPAGGDETPDEGLEEGGERLLELLARLDCPPPTLVVKRKRTLREDARSLHRALSAGVFAVLEPPVEIETILKAMHRVLDRHYCGRWPTTN